MKRLSLLFCAALLMSSLVACSDEPVTFPQLPSAAQKFVNQYFADTTVSHITVDKDMFDRSYDVFFADGSSIEFDRKGEWKDIDCVRNAVPEAIIPEAIRDYIATNYTDVFVCEINRDKRDWEVGLSNGLDLKFDTKFRLIELDD